MAGQRRIRRSQRSVYMDPSGTAESSLQLRPDPCDTGTDATGDEARRVTHIETKKMEKSKILLKSR